MVFPLREQEIGRILYICTIKSEFIVCYLYTFSCYSFGLNVTKADASGSSSTC